MVTIKNPMKPVWEKEEKLYSKELSTQLTKALQGKDVKKKIDALNSASNSSNKPTKEILALYRKELDALLKKKAKGYAGMELSATLTVKGKAGSFLPEVAAKTEYITTWRGQVKHTATASDTLQTISEKYYGHMMYWNVLEQANQFSFFEGAVITVPMIEVIKDTSSTKVKPGSGGKVKPVKVLYPEVSYSFEKSKSQSTVHLFPGIPLAVHITWTLKGAITLKKAGTISASFDPKSHSVAMTKKASGITGSLTLNKFKPTAVGYSVDLLGKKWSANISLTKDFSAKLSLAPKPVSVKLNDVLVEGSAGIDIEFRVYPTKQWKPPRVPTPNPHPIYEFATDVLKAMVVIELTLLGAGLVPQMGGAGGFQPATGIVGGAGGPVPYDFYDEYGA